jgi:hypothetical protein
MSVASSESQLDKAFGILLAKARQREEQQRIEQAQSSALIMNFDGAGQVLTVGMGGLPEMPSGAFRIVGAHLAAGIWNPTSLSVVPITVTASVDIRLASHGMWQGGARPLYGTTRPGLTAQAEADIDVSGWITELQPGDILAYALATFDGTATVLTLTLTLRRINVVGIDAPGVTDGSGTDFTDSSGRSFTTRS